MANYDLTYEGSEVQKILDTGDELQTAGYIFRGEATPSTVPGTPTERVAYIGGPGTYTNFGGSITVGAGCICVFKYTGSAWSNQVINTGLDSAVNTLQSAITAINNNIGNGYVYAGVATPSTSPVTGKVFYLAVQAGTYTNFGNAVVTAGLNVIKYNGSAWSVDQVIAIDAEPTQGSANLVKSGGVLNSIIQNGPAFDLSAYNAQGGVLATYADLSAALTAINALPADFKKGGMSMKFVLSSDNKYVQYRLMADEFTTDTTQWAIAEEGVYVDNPEFVYVKTDAGGKILWAIKTDGGIYYGAGIPQQVIDYINEKIAELSLDEYEDIVAFLDGIINKQPIFTNKKVSIIGDSISTFAGYIPDGYPSWYPHENDRSSDVVSVNDTWWKKLIDATNSTLVVNASASGSTASSNYIGFSPRVPMLGNSDVIIVALGSNDSGRAVPIGNIDFDAETYDLTQFAPAYIKGIKDTIASYPYARIICLAFDMGIEYQNTIKTIAEHYCIEYIYVGDISDVHPNKAEMQAVFEKIYNTYTLSGLLANKVDKEEGKSLIDEEYASTKSTIDNPEFLYVTTDSEDKVLEGIQKDGTKVIGGSINVGGNARILGNMEVSGVSYKVIENQEYLAAWLDAEDKVIFGFKADGKTYVGDADFLNDIENIKAFLANITDKNIDWDALSSITTAENPEFLEAKTDSEGKLLAGRTPDGAAFEKVGFSTPKVSIDGHIIEDIEDPESRREITIDSEDKIVSYRKDDGTKVENVGLETPSVSTDSLNLSESGMTEFQQALKNAGFQPGGAGDWSDYISNDGKNPLQLPIPQIAKINYICAIDSLSNLSKSDRPDGQEGVNYDVPSYVEYWDTLGNYFKKPSKISGQGNSTMNDPMRSIAMDLFDSDDFDNAFAIKFGDWVAQDSFHVKAYYKDVTKGVSTISYKIGEAITKFLDARANRLSKNIFNISAAGGSGKAKYDYSTNALCHPDGFPVEVYHNGNYYGLSVLSLKKHRANYSMDKDDYSSVLIDNIGSFNWKNGTLNWSSAEIRNPKTLYCMDGTKYDGDDPKELIDSTSQYYDGTNTTHVKTAETKALILSFLSAYGDIRNEQDVAIRKNMWRQHFDIENAIAYIIFSNLTYNQDGWMNNAQISIYNNKMGFNIYDCDSCLGKSWNGAIWSCSAKGIMIKPSTGHILFYIAKDFEDEIKAAYQALRDSKVIDVNNLSQFMIDWSNRIGYEAYKKSIDTWTNSPSYSLGNLNSEYWRQIVIGTEDLPSEYDDTVPYNKGDKCSIGSDLSYNTCIFECVKNTEPGQSPLTSGSLPTGCYDSPYRYKKWFTLRINVLDTYYNYN